MATTDIQLPVRAATLIDDSAGSAIPEIVREMTTDATDPQLAQFVAKFDDAINEHLFWQFRLPSNYRRASSSTAHTLHVLFYMDDDQADNTKRVQWMAAVLKVTPRGAGGNPAGDADEMTSLDMANDLEAAAAAIMILDHADPATDDRLYAAAIDLSALWNDLTAGDYVIVALYRQAEPSTADTAGGDACVVAVALEIPV